MFPAMTPEQCLHSSSVNPILIVLPIKGTGYSIMYIYSVIVPVGKIGRAPQTLSKSLQPAASNLPTAPQNLFRSHS